MLTHGNVATVDPDDTGIGQARTWTPRTTVLVSAAPVATLTRPQYPIDPTWGTPLHDFEAQVAALINEHRASIGVPTLRQSTGALSFSAEWKSMHMAGYQYMTHDDPAPPVVRTVADRFFDAGYGDYEGQLAWGENIAYGFLTPDTVMAAWLSDVGHKANVEQSFWVAVGVGVAQAANGLIFWTTDFGTADPPIGGGSPPPPPPPPPPVQKIAVGQAWTENQTGDLGHVTRVASAGVTWRRAKKHAGHPIRVTSTAASFRLAFTYVSG